MANPFSGLVKRATDYFGDKSKTIMEHLSGMFTGRRSFVVDENAVLSITPAWRAIYILKDILAVMPLNLYEKQTDGDILLRESHPLNKLIAVSPHALYTPYEWMSAMIVNALVSGNGISRIYRNGSGIATALEIIPHDQVRDILMGDDGQHLVYVLVSGKTLHSDDVVHFMGLSINGLSGFNTTKTHADTFASEAAMRDYIRSFLEKGAFLSGVIEHPTLLTDQAYKKAKSSWDSAFGGSGKAGGTAWLEGGATYKRIQSNIVESGFETVKASSVADTSRIYGVPEYMIDGKNKPTYAGQEQGDIQFKKYTIDGWCTKIKQELTRKLVPSIQQGKLFFDYDQSGLLNGDLATMGNYYQKLFNMSILNRDEIRKLIKRNNVTGGERYFIQGNNMLPVDKIDEMIAQKSNTPDPGADMNTITE